MKRNTTIFEEHEFTEAEFVKAMGLEGKTLYGVGFDENNRKLNIRIRVIING